MKTTMFIVAIVAALGMFACQENNSLNPVADQEISSAATSLSMPPPQSNSIMLKGLLRDPIPFNSFVQIDGEVFFSVAGQTLCEVTLKTSAKLTPYWSHAGDGIYWKVNGLTCERYKLLVGSSATFENVYPVEGRADRVFLHLNFTVSREKENISPKVQLNRMWLEGRQIPVPAEENKD